jgi:nicotinate-nucleotide pyrophosphorylase (carboxylating)
MTAEDEKLVNILRTSLQEDIGDGDITTNWTVDANISLTGRFVCKEPGIVAGLDIARQIYLLLDERTLLTPLIPDGARVDGGTCIARVRGSGRILLSAERVVLNFLQRMSGIATLTRAYVDEVRGTNASILDTRKTVPGLRIVDKLAVVIGGGRNHRFGLYDAVLIKENHIAAAGGLEKAIERVRQCDEKNRPICVEAKNLDEVRRALTAGAGYILLDNMTVSEIRSAVELVGGRVPLEASGSISLANVRTVAETGVDYISVGALTHSPKALDISFLIESSNG